ncbi:MAG: response regulator transcription factor [Cyanobacteria bacterium J06643_13]
MINVLIVDDQKLTHRLVETYLETEPEIKIVGFANDGREAIDKIPLLQPDVILMDVEMPRMDGLSATKIITQEFPQTKVLILTVHDNEQHLSRALKNGAKGYLLKTTTAQELKNAISYANQGYFQLSVELTEKYLQKIIISRSEFEEISKINRQVSYLHKSLGRVERQLKDNPQNELAESLELKIEDTLQKEMAMVRDRDSHLQFKVDRMKYNQERMEKHVSYLFKIQLASIAITLLLISYIYFLTLRG